MSINSKQSLGYLGEDFQYKLVHAFMDDKEFFKDLNAIVDQNMFTNPTLKVFVGVMKEYYEREEAVPSYTMMGIALNEKSHNDIEKETFEATLEKIKNTESDGSNYIRTLAEKFFKQQNIVRVANEILRIAGNGDVSQFERCQELLSQALSQGNHDDLGQSVFDDLGETLSKDYRVTIPTGIGKLDEALEGGLAKGELGVIIGSSSFGKAQPLYSKIATPSGFVKMGDIKVGDKVIGTDGQAHNVVGVFPQGKRDVYRVRFSNGTECECDYEHLWTITTNKDSHEKTITLREIHEKLEEDSDLRVYIPKFEALEFEENDLIDEHYEFGFDLGKEISEKAESDIFDSFEPCIFDTFKHRCEILNGILDASGQQPSYGVVRVFALNEQIANTLAMLVRSLGERADVVQSKVVDRENGIYLSYYWVYIKVNNRKIKLFSDSSKQKNLDYYYAERDELPYFTEIEKVGNTEAQCIMVDVPNHLYLTDDFIVTHNTSITTAMANYAATYKCEQNADKGFKVLQIVFEDRIKQIQRKHIGRLTNIEAKDLSKEENIDYVKQMIESYEDKDMLQQNLRIKKFPSGELTAIKIKDFIKKLINNGFRPDLVIIDYFECLYHVGDESTTNEYEKEGKTMRKLEAMAGELNMAFWIPTQGTKESVNMELVTMDKAGGSFKKIQIAHIVVSIARTMEEIEKSKATIALLKNRAGGSGKVFNNVEFNNGTCRISTDNIDEFDNMLDFKKKNQEDMTKMASEIFKRSRQRYEEKNQLT